MTIREKVFQTLVLEGKQRTAAQLAAQMKTTPATVRARISELRDEGYVIQATQRTDSKGRTKTFYRQGSPTRSMVAAGRLLHKALRDGIRKVR